MRVVRIGVRATYGSKVSLEVGHIDRKYLGELYQVAKCESRNMSKPWVDFHYTIGIHEIISKPLVIDATK
jgi:hypothetical protein